MPGLVSCTVSTQLAPRQRTVLSSSLPLSLSLLGCEHRSHNLSRLIMHPAAFQVAVAEMHRLLQLPRVNKSKLQKQLELVEAAAASGAAAAAEVAAAKEAAAAAEVKRAEAAAAAAADVAAAKEVAAAAEVKRAEAAVAAAAEVAAVKEALAERDKELKERELKVSKAACGCAPQWLRVGERNTTQCGPGGSEWRRWAAPRQLPF